MFTAALFTNGERNGEMEKELPMYILKTHDGLKVTKYAFKEAREIF